MNHHSRAKVLVLRQAALAVSVAAMTGMEILANLAWVQRTITVKGAIQVAEVEAVGMEEVAAAMDMALIVQVEEEVQAGHSLSRASKIGNQVTLQMHLSLL